MLTALTDLALRHPRRMAVLTLVFFIAAGVYGGPAAGLLNARNGFVAPSSPSARAQQAIERATGAEDSPGVLALVSIPLWLIVWLLTALGTLLFISATCDGPSKDRSSQGKHRTS